MYVYLIYCYMISYPIWCYFLGIEIEITIFFIHLLFLFSPTISIFLCMINLLLMGFLCQEIWKRERLLIQSKSKFVYKKECIICYETRIRSHQLHCCNASIICRSCFSRICKCPICRRKIEKETGRLL